MYYYYYYYYYYYSGGQIWKNGTGGACSTYGEEERCTQGFRGETERKRLLGTPRRRWDDNIKIDLQKVEWGYGGE